MKKSKKKYIVLGSVFAICGIILAQTVIFAYVHASNTYKAEDIKVEVDKDLVIPDINVNSDVNFSVNLKLLAPEILKTGASGDTIVFNGKNYHVDRVGLGLVIKGQESKYCGAVTNGLAECNFPYVANVPPGTLSYFSKISIPANVVLREIEKRTMGLYDPVSAYETRQLSLVPFLEFTEQGKLAFFAATANVNISPLQQIDVNGKVLADASQSDSESAFFKFLNLLISTVTFLIQGIIFIFFAVLIAPFIVVLLNIRTYTDNFANVIYFAWEIIRNLTNIFFILVLVAVGLGTLFRISGWQAKDVLVKLIVGAILVNFSLVIAQSVLGIADTVQNQFLPNSYNSVAQLGWKLMVDGTKDTLFNSFPGDSALKTGQFVTTIRLIIMLILAIFSFFMFVAIFIFLVIRIVALWLLLMTSPLPWAAMVLPATKKWAGKWWGNFFKYAFQTPIIAFMLNLTAVISVKQGNVIQKVASSGQVGSLSQDFMWAIGSNLVLVAFMFMSLKVASSFGTWGSAAVMKGVQAGTMGAAGLAGLGLLGAAKGTAKTATLQTGNLLEKAGWTDKGGGARNVAQKAVSFAGGVTSPQLYKDMAKSFKEGRKEKADARMANFYGDHGKMHPDYVRKEVLSAGGASTMWNKMKLGYRRAADAGKPGGFEAQRELDSQKVSTLMTNEQIAKEQANNNAEKLSYSQDRMLLPGNKVTEAGAQRIAVQLNEQIRLDTDELKIKEQELKAMGNDPTKDVGADVFRRQRLQNEVQTLSDRKADSEVQLQAVNNQLNDKRKPGEANFGKPLDTTSFAGAAKQYGQSLNTKSTQLDAKIKDFATKVTEDQTKRAALGVRDWTEEDKKKTAARIAQTDQLVSKSSLPESFAGHAYMEKAIDEIAKSFTKYETPQSINEKINSGKTPAVKLAALRRSYEDSTIQDLAKLNNFGGDAEGIKAYTASVLNSSGKRGNQAAHYMYQYGKIAESQKNFTAAGMVDVADDGKLQVLNSDDQLKKQLKSALGKDGGFGQAVRKMTVPNVIADVKVTATDGTTSIEPQINSLFVEVLKKAKNANDFKAIGSIPLATREKIKEVIVPAYGGESKLISYLKGKGVDQQAIDKLINVVKGSDKETMPDYIEVAT